MLLNISKNWNAYVLGKALAWKIKTLNKSNQRIHHVGKQSSELRSTAKHFAKYSAKHHHDHAKGPNHKPKTRQETPATQALKHPIKIPPRNDEARRGTKYGDWGRHYARNCADVGLVCRKRSLEVYSRGQWRKRNPVFTSQRKVKKLLPVV